MTCGASPLLLSEGIQTRAKGSSSQSGAVGRAESAVEWGAGMPGILCRALPPALTRNRLLPMEGGETGVGNPVSPSPFPSPFNTTSTPF